jgi:hypothetical protein
LYALKVQSSLEHILRRRQPQGGLSQVGLRLPPNLTVVVHVVYVLGQLVPVAAQTL